MLVTKYPQSCLVVEVQDRRLLIDPGTFFSAAYDLDQLGDLHGVLVTHRHADHLDPALLAPLKANGWPLHGNADVAELVGDGSVRQVISGRPFDVAGLEVIPYDLPHVPLVDGSPGPPNTGFLIDGTLFHPGDGLELSGVGAPVVAAPISGPSISFHDAYRFVERFGAHTVVPIHYDSFVADPRHFARLCDLADVVVLDDGESARV